MRSFHEVIFNQGAQSIYSYAKDRDERPIVLGTDPTYVIEDLRKSDAASDREVQASATATRDSTSTTLDAAAGPSSADSYKLSVASASGFTEGLPYLVEEAGKRALVICDDIDSTNDNVYTRYPLGRDFASGATVKGLRVTATFPSAEANDESATVDDRGGPYRITWTATIQGATDWWSEIIWVVRERQSVRITEADVLLRDPTLRERFGKLEGFIVAASQDYEAVLRANQLDPNHFSASIETPTVAARTIWYARTMRGVADNDERVALVFHEQWETFIAQIKGGRGPRGTVSVHPIDDTAPAGSDQTHRSLFRRS